MASHGKRVHPVSPKPRRKVLRAGTRIIAIPQYAPRDAEDPGPVNPWDAIVSAGQQMVYYWSRAYADPMKDLMEAMKKMQIEEQKALDRAATRISAHDSGTAIDLNTTGKKRPDKKPKQPRQDEPAYVKLTRKKRR